MKVYYEKNGSMTVQGTRAEIDKKYGREWTIREQGDGTGNWLITKKSDVSVDGKSCRDFVLDHYSRPKLTEKLSDKFREDLANDVITPVQFNL